MYENEGGVSLIRYASNSFRLATNFAGNLDLGANASTVMTLENGGNVGIGTTDPSQALHVVGSVLSVPTSGEGYLYLGDTS